MAERWLILPDTHYPVVDEVWEALAIKAAEALRPDVVLHLGDGIEADACSSHAKASFAEADQTASLFTEYFGYTSFLNRIHDAARGCRFVIHAGNHEFRVERMAASLGGQFGRDVFAALDPKTHIMAEIKGPAQWVNYNQREPNFFEITPDLVSCHGWRHSKNVAAAHLDLARGKSIVFGHCHRHQVHTGTTLDGRTIVSWCPGYGGTLRPLWKHGAPVDWVLGFTCLFISSHDRTNWTPDHCIVRKTPNGGGTVVVNGKELRV